MEANRIRILFLGTPGFATIPLRALIAAGFPIAGVVTQPDRPIGRSATPQPPPVKQLALQHGLSVLQPQTLRDPEAIAALEAFQPDLGIVAAYGEILRKRVLEIPRLGYLNIHPSLLPLHRGPTPVSGAIMAGDQVTGVSIMQLDRGMDSGPLLAQLSVDLPADARSGTLTDELFELGSRLLIELLPAYAAGRIQPRPQEHSQASYTRMLRKEDSRIDWSLPALVIERMTRAYDPWPGANCSWRGQPLRILRARVDADWQVDQPPGTLLSNEIAQVATGSGALELLEVQPSGKRPMAGRDWLRGARAAAGEQLA